jgi:hypothetical protein
LWISNLTVREALFVGLFCEIISAITVCMIDMRSVQERIARKMATPAPAPVAPILSVLRAGDE